MKIAAVILGVLVYIALYLGAILGFIYLAVKVIQAALG